MMPLSDWDIRYYEQPKPLKNKNIMTANKGASITRSRILRKIKRMHPVDPRAGWRFDVEGLIKFINTMDDRSNKKKGGLGRK